MERLTQTSDKGGVAFTFDLDVTCQPSEMKKILKIAEKLKEFEDLEELIGVPIKTLAKLFNDHIPEDCKNPKKAIVLTDDDVDKWQDYKMFMNKYCIEGDSKVSEIVKQSGVSEDVCEWHKDGLFLYTSCNDRVDTYSYDFKYCPYCSKQIKVVDNDK